MKQKSREMARLAFEALDDKKGEDIRIIDISRISTISDYFLIVHGNSVSQTKALEESVREKLGKAGFSPEQVEGNGTGTWILMDYSDVIIHIFDRDSRRFYDLEHIWIDGRDVLLEDL